ncbi:RNA polymerase II transcriptional coactivator-like [Clytia hemisphaerica]|uniref:Transcriptional coactivator p15 (PC4) C-terminal domain-containing protein n=1 Tax=Clytia hemisphaerica TaxID=252671 RepID=A0A7M5WQD7_9CNID
MGKVKSEEFVPSEADSSTEEESDEPKKKETTKKKPQKPAPEKRERKKPMERRPLSESEEEDEKDEPVAKKSRKEESPKKKKQESSSSGSGSKMVTTKDGEVYWELTHNRRVGLSEFRGKMFVNIREYYEKNGELLPGRKGISLPMEQWKKLSKLSKEINHHIEEEGY